MTSTAAGLPPLYGTCVSAAPVAPRSISPAMCPTDPVPDDPNVRPSGRDLPSATSSFTELARVPGATDTAVACEAMRMIGARSFVASYGSLPCSPGLSARAMLASMIV